MREGKKKENKREQTEVKRQGKSGSALTHFKEMIKKGLIWTCLGCDVLGKLRRGERKGKVILKRLLVSECNYKQDATKESIISNNAHEETSLEIYVKPKQSTTSQDEPNIYNEMLASF
jgi:hypothetical protein